MSVSTLFNAAAEALILLDPNDASSTAELVSRFTEIRALFTGDVDSAHPAVVALEAAERLAAGDTTAAAVLEDAYASARALALESASTGAGTSATSGPRSKGKRPRKAATPANAKRDAPEDTAGADMSTTHDSASEQPTSMPLAGDEELLRDFGIRAVEHLDDADEHILELETDPEDAAAVDAVFRGFHTIKGMAGFLSLDAVSNHAHASESLLAGARAGDEAVSPQTIQALFCAVDHMRELVAAATGIGGDGPMRSSAVTQADRAAARTGSLTGRGGTVRVEEVRLDGLLDTIGEMVIAESMVSASVRTGADLHALAAHVDRLDKITRELQQMATSLRMVPLRSTFRNMTRLVRDLSHRADKPVEFTISGEDTEIDKEVADRLTDPLVHALRNAVDHGIESAAERRAAGKPTPGQIHLSARQTGGSIHVEIRDDGRGLDAAHIRERAVERGLIAADEPLDHAAALELLFQPGFSTAEKLSDVSGRGVGMDVVRRTAEGLRGRVDLDSEPGHGTRVSIRLPITLAIIDGMVVRVGDERYVIPVLSIERSVRPDAEQIARVQGSGEMLVSDDGLVPLVRLHRLFGTPGAQEDPAEAVVVITRDGGSRVGLLVCELLGQQQTVIKPLGDGVAAQEGVSGGAIMPDGRVGLILDAAGLIRLAREEGDASRVQTAEGT